MNNKKLVIFSFVSLILFGLVFKFAFGHTNSASSSVVVEGDGYAIANWTKGGVNATVNFTLTFIDNLDGENISNITIEIPTIVTVGDLAQTFINGSESAGGAGGISNGTYSSTGGWGCVAMNTTSEVSQDFTNRWECTNSTSGGMNNGSSINIWFNYTGNTSFEGEVEWVIYTQTFDGQVNTTRLSSNVDNLGPRLIELNVSDGYTALGNGSGAMNISRIRNDINTLENDTLRADYMTITVTLEDGGDGAPALTTNNVYLYYLTNDTNVTEVDYENEPNYGVKMTTSNTASPYMFTSTISGLIENNITTFVFVTNDTFQNKAYLNNTGVADDEAYALLTNSTNVPSLTLVNISDGGYNITAATGGYLRTGTHTFTVRVSGRYMFDGLEGNQIDRSFASDGVLLYYNTTGNITSDVNGYIAANETSNPIFATNNTNNVTDVDNYLVEFSGTLDISDNNTNTVYYAIVANNSNLNATYYTLLTGQYIIDSAGPGGTSITSNDADNRITTGSSVTFTCAATDSGVGINSNKYVWKITDTTVTDQTDSTLALTSSSSYVNTNTAGSYTAKCTPYDSLGNAGTEGTLAFTLTSSVGGTSTAGGGGGSSSTTPSFDVDLSTSTAGSISGTVGRIKSFSFDGSTKHTVTFKEITATSAKITIASTPIDVVLNVGETKKVDLNSDGTNDLEVTLDNIKFGTNAEITIKKLETGVKKIVEEEKKVAEEAKAAEEAKTAEAAKGTGWLWITILIIIVLVTVGYYVFKKK